MKIARFAYVPTVRRCRGIKNTGRTRSKNSSKECNPFHNSFNLIVASNSDAIVPLVPCSWDSCAVIITLFCKFHRPTKSYFLKRVCEENKSTLLECRATDRRLQLTLVPVTPVSAITLYISVHDHQILQFIISSSWTAYLVQVIGYECKRVRRLQSYSI